MVNPAHSWLCFAIVVFGGLKQTSATVKCVPISGAPAPAGAITESSILMHSGSPGVRLADFRSLRAYQAAIGAEGEAKMGKVSGLSSPGHSSVYSVGRVLVPSSERW